jgi:cytochrome c553
MQYTYSRLSGYWLTLFFLPAAAIHAAPTADGSRLYARCGACHATTAWGSVDGAIPDLAGQSSRYLAKQIASFSSGARVDSTMPMVTTHSTLDNPRDAVVLTDYLAQLDWNPRAVTGSGEHLRLGQETYAHICAACHGADGRAQAAEAVPRIAGQHYPYLRLQIESAAALHRDLAPPEMTSALRSMDQQQKDALADYVSRLGNSEIVSDTNPSGGPPRLDTQ